ncbi:MAG: SIMPL domain-containing protein [Desulfotignum sp.]|nr:SIMPL domain-containing protein [Desulfotignum sp.]MCF8089391.1 SIMPL domain-containing protein [Desulfotignum sp.]MCF8137841.1 SIMPL domain-containing protein [Desulfotignum sp.]
MAENKRYDSFILGVCLVIGLGLLGFLLGNALIQFKQSDRTVTVKGLSEREYEADIVIWPIQFTTVGNELEDLYSAIDQSAESIQTFLQNAGIKQEEITVSTPAIVDKSAQQYGNESTLLFRYTASQSVTVYSDNIKAVRTVMGKLSELGKQGIVLTGENYESQTEYIFTRLNDVKPDMIEEATKKAREVAEKFALDSKSKLGKIRSASQGQFSIRPRDKNNPHIKQIRVVSTISYFLSD